MRTTTRPAKVQELFDLPATTDLPTAGRFFHLGRDASYEAHRRGDFPVPVLKIGARLIVTRAALADALGVNLDADALTRQVS